MDDLFLDWGTEEIGSLVMIYRLYCVQYRGQNNYISV